MTTHPMPLDLMTGGDCIQALPQVGVCHRFAIAGLPAAPLPIGDPFTDALLHILRVGGKPDLTWPCQRLQRDAGVLLDRATFDGEQIASAAVSAEVRFATPEDRAAFMREYLETTRELLDRHGNQQGAPYRVVLAVHPDTEGSLQ